MFDLSSTFGGYARLVSGLLVVLFGFEVWLVLSPARRARGRRLAQTIEDRLDRRALDAAFADPANADPIAWDDVKAELAQDRARTLGRDQATGE